MSVKAQRTVPIPLTVPDDRVADLHATYDPYQHCQNRTVDWCWPNQPKQPDDLTTSKGDAEDALYHDLREATDYNLNANLVQKAIKDAVGAVGSCKTSWKNGDRISKPAFEDHDDASYTMTYDKRAATYHRYKASFAVINGDPVECQYELPEDLTGTPYERYVLDARWSFSTSKLVYDGERFWLHAVMKRRYAEDPVYPPASDGSDTQEDFTRVLGVDLNVNGYSAVTSAGGFHGNADYLNHQRREFEKRRASLQQTDTRSAHLTFHRIGDRFGRWSRDYLHRVSKEIVAEARRHGCTHIAFENLEQIRARISDGKKFQHIGL